MKRPTHLSRRSLQIILSVDLELSFPLYPLSASLFAIYIAISCLGLYLIKVADSWKTPTFIAGLAFYGVGAIVWMGILRLMPLSHAFPVAAGALVIGTIFVGIVFLSETVSVWQGVGAFLIIAGITLIATDR